MFFIYSLMMRGLSIMNKYIVVNLNMFAKENQVFIVSPNEDTFQIGVYTIEQLPKALLKLAYDQDIYNIRIAGNSKYSKLVEFGIEQAEITKYNERKINVEVI